MASFNGVFRCAVENHEILVDHIPHGPNQYNPHGLNIRFQRMIRVPKDANQYKISPKGLGRFPLSKVRDYAAKLPSSIAGKGGVFFPMYQKEAMWIELRLTGPFMIKFYSGGVNVMSCESCLEDRSTKIRPVLANNDKNIQDYVVTPNQSSLDGIATSSGVLRQFVAVPFRGGCAFEAQFMGQEGVGGLQIEITPSLPKKQAPDIVWPPCTPSEDFIIYVKTLVGEITVMPCSLRDQIGNVRGSIWDQEGIALEQERLTYYGRQLTSEETLEDIGVQNKHTLHILLTLRGYACNTCGNGRITPMSIALDGKINQVVSKDPYAPDTWSRASTLTIPVHIMNIATFCEITGEDPPPCPITAATYARAGLPVFDFPEKPIDIPWSYGIITNGNQPIVKPQEQKQYGDVVETHCIDMSSLDDPDGLLNPEGPLREFRTLTDLQNELRSKNEDTN
ncbi:hypothetical protein F5Y19DRAFT_477702 [Xylariaceae sp. FL1651]|nr:hypothetical protein F5Y19DRAFT_477702 [Xylariaceae sp. FL1651]